MVTEQNFINQILHEPENELHPLVYADWLEERGDPRSELFRIQGQLCESTLSSQQKKELSKRLSQLFHQGVDSPLISWRCIEIGGTSKQDLLRRLEQAENPRLRISDWARDMVLQDSWDVLKEKTSLILVKRSVYELGFTEPTRYDVICQEAKERGFDLCPPEVGLQLRLQYLDQPERKWLIIAMKAIPDALGDPRVFGVVHRSYGLWLYGRFGSPGLLWYPDEQFVFCARKNLVP